jgi:hypothetical protein
MHGEKPVCLAKQGEVGPEDTTQEAHAVDDHLNRRHGDFKCQQIQYLIDFVGAGNSRNS